MAGSLYKVLKQDVHFIFEGFVKICITVALGNVSVFFYNKNRRCYLGVGRANTTFIKMMIH